MHGAPYSSRTCAVPLFGTARYPCLVPRMCVRTLCRKHVALVKHKPDAYTATMQLLSVSSCTTLNVGSAHAPHLYHLAATHSDEPIELGG